MFASMIAYSYIAPTKDNKPFYSAIIVNNCLNMVYGLEIVEETVDRKSVFFSFNLFS